MKKKFIVSIIVSLVLAGVIFLLDPFLNRFPHLEDQGAHWYFWKLPKATFWGTFTAWGGYILHQITVFYMIIKGKKSKSDIFTNKFLLVNLFFVILHIVQTHIFYDGTAQQVPVWSSQYSVILMLSITLVLLQPKRGFFLGRFRRVDKKVSQFFKKYHGIYISWALVYTFWFHPAEGDWAILIGFIYMFFLFIHMSMFRTKMHTNIKWITFLETYVVLHGVGIALMNGQSIWPMFFTGFLFMFFYTYMYGLNLSKRVRILLHCLYFIIVGLAYYNRGYNKIYEITYIPIILYGVALVMIGIVKVGMLLKKK